MWAYDQELQKLRISVNIETTRLSEHKTIIGIRGTKIKTICKECEENLKEFFGHEVEFRINLLPMFTVKPEPMPETKNVDLFI